MTSSSFLDDVNRFNLQSPTIDLVIIDQTFSYLQADLEKIWKSYSQFGSLLIELLIWASLATFPELCAQCLLTISSQYSRLCSVRKEEGAGRGGSVLQFLSHSNRLIISYDIVSHSLLHMSCLVVQYPLSPALRYCPQPEYMAFSPDIWRNSNEKEKILLYFGISFRSSQIYNIKGYQFYMAVFFWYLGKSDLFSNDVIT